MLSPVQLPKVFHQQFFTVLQLQFQTRFPTQSQLPDTPFPCFYSQKAWVSPKTVSLLFCPFLCFLALKRLRSRIFRFSTHAFLSKLRCLTPQLPLSRKKEGVELTPKKAQETKTHRKGDQSFFHNESTCWINPGGLVLILASGSFSPLISPDFSHHNFKPPIEWPG